MGRRRYNKRQTKKYWRMNNQIRADKVRVVDEKEQLGLMSVPEALKLAREQELDLVEIAPKARPPVVKIVDFGKFKYKQEKKEKKSKAKIKKADVKEVRFSPFIGEADYRTRLKKVNGFLKEGHKIRPVVKFKGRQMGSKKFGYGLMKRLLEDVETNVVVDMEPKFLGRHLAMVISPTYKRSTQDKIDRKQEKAG